MPQHTCKCVNLWLLTTYVTVCTLTHMRQYLNTYATVICIPTSATALYVIKSRYPVWCDTSNQCDVIHVALLLQQMCLVCVLWVGDRGSRARLQTAVSDHRANSLLCDETQVWYSHMCDTVTCAQDKTLSHCRSCAHVAVSHMWLYHTFDSMTHLERGVSLADFMSCARVMVWTCRARLQTLSHEHKAYSLIERVCKSIQFFVAELPTVRL